MELLSSDSEPDFEGDINFMGYGSNHRTILKKPAVRPRKSPRKSTRSLRSENEDVIVVDHPGFMDTLSVADIKDDEDSASEDLECPSTKKF
jgi:hypothetical protein